MKQYNIKYDSNAFIAYVKHYDIDMDQPGAFSNMTRFLAGANCKQMGSMQAWVLTDEAGNKWLQSYYTIVSVKWANTGTFERFGKWSVTTSKQQTYFERNF